MRLDLERCVRNAASGFIGILVSPSSLMYSLSSSAYCISNIALIRVEDWERGTNNTL